MRPLYEITDDFARRIAPGQSGNAAAGVAARKLVCVDLSEL